MDINIVYHHHHCHCHHLHNDYSTFSTVNVESFSGLKWV
jgi:hypothetical protein